MGKNTEQKTNTEEIKVMPDEVQENQDEKVLPAEAPKNHDDEKVDIFIERAVGNEDPNLFVSVNGVNYLLPRGQTSRVPKVIAEEINRSRMAQQRQDQRIDELKDAQKSK